MRERCGGQFLLVAKQGSLFLRRSNFLARPRLKRLNLRQYFDQLFRSNSEHMPAKLIPQIMNQFNVYIDDITSLLRSTFMYLIEGLRCNDKFIKRVHMFTTSNMTYNIIICFV